MKFPVRESDVQRLIRKHAPIASPGYSKTARTKEATQLLRQYGPCQTYHQYPVWHPIARSIAALHGRCAAKDFEGPPQELFDHAEEFRWATIGWPYTPPRNGMEKLIEFQKATRAMGVIWDHSETHLYNEGTPLCYLLAVDPGLVDVWEHYSENEWVAFLRFAIGQSHNDFLDQPQCLESYSRMQRELFGSSEGGRFLPAFTPRLIERMRPICMKAQLLWVARANDWTVEDTLRQATAHIEEDDHRTLQEIFAK